MSDYTKIDLAHDPLHQRLSGVTYHQNLSFDVPYISHIEGNLYVGGCADGLILPDHIVNLVSLYPWERYSLRKPLISELYVKAYDDDVRDLQPHLERLARWVVDCLEQGPTLVHCQAGLNRSSLLAALVLIRKGGDPGQVISLLREKRSSAVLCNRSFESFLLGL